MKYRIKIGYYDGECWQNFDVIVDHHDAKGWKGLPEVTITKVEEAEG